MKGIPGIKEFPSDGRYWRVDWFGAIQPNPRVAREPALQVIITPFKTNDIQQLTPNQLASASSSIVDYQQQRTILVGSGQLPMLCIGSIWYQGKLQNQQAGQMVELRGLHISASNTKVVHAGAKVNEQYLLPFSHYRYGSDGYFSKMLAIEHKGDPYGILIPMAELVRFYFAVSTDLADAIFSGDLKHNLAGVINPENTWSEPTEQREIIGLRQRFSDEDGWVLARILSSETAYQAATKVHDAMMRNRLNNKPAQLECGFPFTGYTTLTAHCKSIPDGEQQWRYLALSLTHCTGTFPFRQLTIYRDNDGRKAEDDDKPAEDKKPSWVGPSTISGDADKPFQSDQAPNRQSSAELFSLPSNRFGDIEGKEPEKPTKEQCEYKSTTRIRPAIVTSQLSSAQSENNESKTGAGRVKSSNERARALPASFETFIKAIEHLNTFEGVRARLRECDERVEFVPLTKHENQRQWSYLESKTMSRRRVLIADIQHKSIFITLIEFEHRENDRCCLAGLRTVNGAKVSNQSIALLLTGLADAKGIWLHVKSHLKEGLKLELYKHVWPTPQILATGVLNKLKMQR